MKSSLDPIGIGVIGMGFMGRTHVRAYQKAIAQGHGAKLLALCDRSSERFDGRGRVLKPLPGEDSAALFDPSQLEFTTNSDALLAREDVQLVSICTHTESHVDLAIQALEAGKNVLLEKPVALRASEVERLMRCADRSPGFCMPAMCMRFWPGWSWLKPAIASGRYGRVLSASFRRLCAKPDWAPEFYADLSRSGGALFDLHIHDADLVQWLFGAPDAVHSSGDLDFVTSSYHYQGGPPHVSAQGGWNHSPGFPFQMHFSIIFERATAEFSSNAEPQLVLFEDGQQKTLELPQEFENGYEGEVLHALEVCRGAAPKLSLQDALDVVQLLESERESLGLGARPKTRSAST